MRYLTIAFLLIAGAYCYGDPGFLTGGGQPEAISGKTTVSMTSEKVTLTVYADRVDVDGTFEFDNRGKACSVRMGFPENASYGLGGKEKKISSVLAHYRSFVDGKAATTKLMPGKKMDEQWDVQTVSFATRGHRTLRIRYSTSLGAMAGKPPTAMTEYILHTGGTWNGPIGSITVDVKLTPSTEVARPYDIWHGNSKMMTEKIFQSQPAKRGGLIAMGPGTVTAVGSTVRFTVKNFKPGASDDVVVVFKYPPKQLEKDSKPGATTPPVPPR